MAATVVLGHADPAARIELREMLRHAADTLVEVGDRDALVEAARGCRPAAIVAHPSVAGGDVVGLTSLVKSDPELFDVAMVVVCPGPDLESTLAHLERGAHHVVREPVEPPELIAAVRSAIRTTRLQRELLERAHSLERMAYRDALTDVPNRRYLLRRLSALLSAAERHERPLSVAIVDIDHFKAINDMFGHAIGDGVLVEVAGRLGVRLREEDEMGRYGGEEFLVLMPETDEDGAAGAGAALRAAIASGPIPTTSGPVAITISVGHATALPGEDEADLIARADEALYRAKRRGRDRVEAALLVV